MLDAKAVLATAERFPWATAAPGEQHWPDGGDLLDVALSAVRPEEHEGYIERLEAFGEQHRARLQELLRTHRPGSRPASHGRYALIGQTETLVILERMEAVPMLLRGQWEKELKDVFLADLEFAWGRASASAGSSRDDQRAEQGDPARPRCCVVSRNQTRSWRRPGQAAPCPRPIRLRPGRVR
ncbi:hypothetical protein [Streptomyces sp. NPDC045369]